MDTPLIRTAPPIYEPGYFALPQSGVTHLDNGTRVVYINFEQMAYSNVIICNDAGMLRQTRPRQASSTVNMVLKGTKRHNAHEISEFFDFNGVAIDTGCGFDCCELNFSSVTRRLPEVLPMIVEIMMEPAFPQEELELHKLDMVQNERQWAEDVNMVSSLQFRKMVFGEDHWFGRRSTISQIEELRREDLMEFFEANLNPPRLMIYIVGNCSEKVLDEFNKHIGGVGMAGKPRPIVHVPETVLKPYEQKIVHREGAVQSAVFMGHICDGIRSDNFFRLQFMNVLLGGYFGSRLMTNIREEKGYCYGIYSSLSSSYHDQSLWYVNSQVSTQNTLKLIDEVKFEMRRLQDELVPDEEMKLVRHYLVGAYLQQVSSKLDTLHLLQKFDRYGLEPTDYFRRKWEAINTVTAEDVREMARTYLHPDNLMVSIAGDC